jgi:hypothetical protein
MARETKKKYHLQRDSERVELTEPEKQRHLRERGREGDKGR